MPLRARRAGRGASFGAVILCSTNSWRSTVDGSRARWSANSLAHRAVRREGRGGVAYRRRRLRVWLWFGAAVLCSFAAALVEAEWWVLVGHQCCVGDDAVDPAVEADDEIEDGRRVTPSE